jgi:hypothetical protein
MQKLNTRSTLQPCLFLLDKFTSEERRENVALYAAAQDVSQVGFRIWPATCFEFDTPVLQIPGQGNGMTVDVT